MRKDFSKKQHSYQPPRKYVKRNKLKSEIFKKRLKYTFLAFLLVAILICAIYWLFFSGFFNIKSIEIKNYPNNEKKQKIEKIIGDNLKEKKWRILPMQNIFLLDKVKLIEKIKENIPTITLNIQKFYIKRSLVINLQERKGSVNLIVRHINQITQNDSLDKEEVVHENYYLIDPEGYITDIKNSKEELSANAVTIIYINDKDKELKKMDKILSETVINKIIFLNQKLSFDSSTYLGGLNVLYFTLDTETPNEVNVQTKEGVELLLSFKNNTIKQLNYLKLAIENQIKDSLKTLKYIDLRTDDKIFYQ